MRIIVFLGALGLSDLSSESYTKVPQVNFGLCLGNLYLKKVHFFDM